MLHVVRIDTLISFPTNQCSIEIEDDFPTSIFRLSTAHVAIIVVIQFPPKLSRKTDVIIEFRYGMCERCFSERATITCSR